MANAKRPDGGREDVLLRGGRVVDPAQGIDGERDVLLRGGRVEQVGRGLPAGDAQVIGIPDGCVVCPGLIDMHVHLREPGQEYKETIRSGALAALAGGFTGIACMPNTVPVNDHPGITTMILRKAAEAASARVYPIGAVTAGSRGEQMTEFGALRDAGCVGVSDDGHPVADALMMRRALEYSSMFDMPVINHCEDPSLKGDGGAHEGPTAAALGLRGIPGAAEEVMVARDVALSELTGGSVHVAHMSVAGSLRAVRSGKERGVRVTCEVTPHHFILTDEQLTYDTNYKMNPPLRAVADRDAMLAGLADGSIDAIATDHAPHHADDKAVEFDKAPFGIIGLETAMPLVLDRLLHTGHLSMTRIVELLATNPARILGLPGGSLAPGSPADVTVLAPDAAVEVRAEEFRSRARNTPFDGWQLRGAVAAVIVGGRIGYVNEHVAAASAFGVSRPASSA